jgi:hypothetical protein
VGQQLGVANRSNFTTQIVARHVNLIGCLGWDRVKWWQGGKVARWQGKVKPSIFTLQPCNFATF